MIPRATTVRRLTLVLLIATLALVSEACAYDYTFEVGKTYNFSVSSDQYGDPIDWWWYTRDGCPFRETNFGSGSAVQYQTGEGPPPRHGPAYGPGCNFIDRYGGYHVTFSSPGTGYITVTDYLCCCDPNSAAPASIYSYEVVGNEPPPPPFLLAISPNPSVVGETIDCQVFANPDAGAPPPYDCISWWIAGAFESYRLTGGAWHKYNPSSDNYDIPSSSAAAHTVSRQFPQPGNYSVECTVINLPESAQGTSIKADLAATAQVGPAPGQDPSGPGQTWEAMPIIVYGDIYDVATGEPISSADVTVTQKQNGRTVITRSNSLGVYTTAGSSIPVQSDYTTTINVTHPNYHPTGIHFQSAPRYDEWYVPLLMMPKDGPPDGEYTVYGYISTKDAQRPLPGATVTLSGVGTTTTTSTGFYRFDNVAPGTYTLSASAPTHTTTSDTITVTSAPLQHDIALTGHYTLNITVKDSETLQLVTNATVISLSDGQGANDQNPATFPVDYGPYTITVTAEGYLPTQQYQYIDKVGETNTTVILTPEPPPPEMPNYPPHSVRFLCIDEYNRPLQNVTIHAVYQESSSPVDWLADWLGISPKVKVNNTAMEGTTGLDGSVVFLMVQSVQYRITVAAPAPINMTKTFDIYPKEDQVTIRFQTRTHTPSAMPTYGLTATETDPSTVRLALTYNDTTNATTHLAFQVYDHATGDLIHTQTFDASKFPGTVSPSYDVSNTNGAMYRFGFTAQNSAHGEISQYKGITLRGDNLLVDLGFEDRTLYQWLAVLLLFLFAGAFSGTNVKQGAILVPLFGGGLFWFIGWLPITLGATISAIGFLGVLLYMRKSEWKVRA